MVQTSSARFTYRPGDDKDVDFLPSRLTQATYAFVLAGGRGSRLMQLTHWCAKPAVPFAGELKVIDFTLSNCINSGIRRVGVLTQYKAQSLIRHLTRAWGFLDAGLGEFVDVVPAQQRTGEGWYSGTANAVYQNLDLVGEAGAQFVLVLAGDHIYKMDYRSIIADHMRRNAEVTVACTEVSVAEASGFGVMRVDDLDRVLAFEEKPARPPTLPHRPDLALASMGIYVFDPAGLREALCRDAADAASSHDFGRDIIPAMVARGRVFAHDFSRSCVNMVNERPYWRDVGTLDAYWEANMDLTHPLPELNLYDDAWPIRSAQKQLPPAKFVFDDDGRRGMAIDSLVSSGCIVSGAQVRRSLLFSKVRVGDGSTVEDSLVLPDVVLGRDVALRRAIIDERCVLPDGIRIGFCPEEDKARFTVTDKGVTLVTRDMIGQRDGGLR